MTLHTANGAIANTIMVTEKITINKNTLVAAGKVYVTLSLRRQRYGFTATRWHQV